MKSRRTQGWQRTVGQPKLRASQRVRTRRADKKFQRKEQSMKVKDEHKAAAHCGAAKLRASQTIPEQEEQTRIPKKEQPNESQDEHQGW